MTPLRLVSMGMIAGLTEKQTWLSNPGRILDLYFWRREYDESLHGIVRQKSDEDGDWD